MLTCSACDMRGTRASFAKPTSFTRACGEQPSAASRTAGSGGSGQHPIVCVSQQPAKYWQPNSSCTGHASIAEGCCSMPAC